MKTTIRVDFHCHTNFSDGGQTPEVLAGSLAEAGVRYAALTDHNTLEGLPRFRNACRKRGISVLPGVELTTWLHGNEIHLLAYGFDPGHAGLAATLLSMRQAHAPEVHSIAGSLRKKGTNLPEGHAAAPAVSVAPDGQLETRKAIELVHHAGGRVFWAHPLSSNAAPHNLDTTLDELIALGLDGLEAFYTPYTAEQTTALRQLAEKHHLLVCAGSDFHGGNGIGGSACGIDMPRPDWITFRQAVLDGAGLSAVEGPGRNLASPRPAVGKPHHFRRRSYVLRIFLPTLIAISLFLATIWGILLPSYEQSLLERKREMIRELTNSAWSILASYESDFQEGLLTREEAQQMAAERIEALRYGPEGKDYFWIQDLQPAMIMHPYRSDLNGQDLSDFTDPRGVAIFVEFADLVRRDGEGYIDYVWQWKDDPERLEPKQSYVRGFEPWGWIIGTGIYTDDVQEEIAQLERRMVNASLTISGVVVVLLLFVLMQSLRIERQRQEMLDSLHESTERYHALAEATTEGTLLILDGRCRYANPTFLEMTAYTARQLEFLDLEDILPRMDENRKAWACFEQAPGKSTPEAAPCEGLLRRADGTLVECVLGMNPIQFAGQNGFILLARDITRPGSLLVEGGITHAAQSVPAGIFRALANRRGTLIESNPEARVFFSSSQPALADLFSDPADLDDLLQALRREGLVRHHLLHTETSDAQSRFISLSARWVHDAREDRDYIDGILEDVTLARRQEAGREALIERLQSSLLFLHEPISRLGLDALSCDMNSSAAALSRQMTSRGVSAALVTGEGGVVLGIVTDADLRARVLAEGTSPQTKVHAIMSAPLTRIPADARIYEALMRMEEKGIRHLAVEDTHGQIVGLIDSKALIQFQRYGPIVLTREIERSADIDEVIRLTGRTPMLVKALLESSARPAPITGMLASTGDAVTSRLVRLAIEELGPPPAEFTFIAMGSQGRQEQTLVTDQDNGIIYAVPNGSDAGKLRSYFLSLGKRVSAGLDRAGYSFCRGGVMAGEERWCRSLPDWIAGLDGWITTSEPQEIINLSIFFDFRAVHGSLELAGALRLATHTALQQNPAIFQFLAANALAFKPPFRLLGSIYLGGGATEHSGEINLKDAMMPLVAFARLYALRHQVNETNTLERIRVLGERNLILPSSCEAMTTAYDLLMQLRLQAQSAALQEGRMPTNNIRPASLGEIQKEMLKQAFSEIAAVQKKIGYDHPGAG